MAKKIRFPLEMKDGAEVRNLEELKENFSLEHVLVYLEDGKLITWLRDRYENEIADAVLALNREDADFYKKICDIFEVEYVETQEDIEKAMERKRKEALLKEVTDEEKFYEVVEQIAFTQDDLYDLLDGEETEIYLCGREFAIPLEKNGIHYIGINNPVAVIVSKEKVDFEEKGITFLGIQFDEKYAEILAAEASSGGVLSEPKEKFMETNILSNEVSVEIEKKLSDEAWEQIEHVVSDLDKFIDSFLKNELKKYERIRIIENDLISLRISYYSSYHNLFETDMKAKMACMKAIEDFINRTYDNYESQRKIVADECNEFVDCIKKDIVDFIVNFTSECKHLAILNCEYEALAYAVKELEVIADKSKLMKQYEDLDFKEKMEGYMQELFMKPIDRKAKLKEYFDMCTYDYDGKRYCYIVNKAIDSIVDSVKEPYNNACRMMENKVKELYKTILMDYCEGIKKELSAMYNKKSDKFRDLTDESSFADDSFSRLFSRNGRNEEKPSEKSSVSLHGLFIKSLEKNLREEFGFNGDFDKNMESSSRNESVSDWWDKHLANAHKSSDR